MTGGRMKMKAKRHQFRRKADLLSRTRLRPFCSRVKSRKRVPSEVPSWGGPWRGGENRTDDPPMTWGRPVVPAFRDRPRLMDPRSHPLLLLILGHVLRRRLHRQVVLGPGDR